jgi:hypothetical protein
MDEFGAFRKIQREVEEGERLKKLVEPAAGLIADVVTGQKSLEQYMQQSKLLARVEEENRLADIIKSAQGQTPHAVNVGQLAHGALDTTKYMHDIAGHFDKPSWSDRMALETQEAVAKLPWADKGLAFDVMNAARAAVEQREQAWMDPLHPSRSIKGMVDLLALQSSMDRLGPFHDTSTRAFQTVLGNWTHVGSMPSNLEVDPVARREYFISRGYDSSIASYPVPALRENLQRAGFVDEPEVNDDEVLGAPQPAEVDLSRDARDLICDFEHELRAFISEKLSAVAGTKWVKQRIHGDVRARWVERKTKDMEARDVDLPLIEYIDFSEYLEVIIAANNWKEVFAAHFRRKESVQESFFRMSPSRNAAMHCREVSQDDWMILSMEVHRVRMAMRERVAPSSSEDWE